jgi:hypothetical protein
MIPPMAPTRSNSSKTKSPANAKKDNNMQSTNDTTYQQIRLAGALGCISILGIHYYYYCYLAFQAWGYTHPIADRFVQSLAHSDLFHYPAISKTLAVLSLALTRIGVRSPAQPRSTARLITAALAGAVLYYGFGFLLTADASPKTLTIAYIATTLAGLSKLYTSIRALLNLVTWLLRRDIFNRYAESFPQEERKITNDYSINFRARYVYRGRTRDSWVNLPEIFRGTLVMGSPGSAKTSHIFRQMIQQSLAHGMCLFVYDLKYDDLTRLTYNTVLREKDRFPVTPAFYSLTCSTSCKRTSTDCSQSSVR